MEPQPMFRITTTVSSAVAGDDMRSPLSSSGNAPTAQLRISDDKCLNLYVTSDVEAVPKEGPVPSYLKKSPPIKKSHSLSEIPTKYHSMGNTDTPTASTQRGSWLSLLVPASQSMRSILPPPQVAEAQPHVVPSSRPQIFFYDRNKPYFNLTNFSPHKVKYKGKMYPTSEHVFQAFKFEQSRPDIAEHIRKFSSRPSVALSEARRYQSEVRKDWKSVNIAKMEEVLWLKFTQHPDLRMELLSTGNSELLEDSDRDSFWGIGAARNGSNELGKALERLRDKLVGG